MKSGVDAAGVFTGEGGGSGQGHELTRVSSSQAARICATILSHL